jgi:hypothetical protein
MPFISVTASGPDIPDGVYPVTLVDIKGPKTVTAQRGPKAGQDIELLDWQFAVDDGPHDGVLIEVSTSLASGPRSKMYGFLTALFNGVAPNIGTNFEKPELVGRRALATVKKDEAGWLRIENLGAMPISMQQARLAKDTGAPVAPAGSPAPAQSTGTAREAVAAGATSSDDLPF